MPTAIGAAAEGTGVSTAPGAGPTRRRPPPITAAARARSERARAISAPRPVGRHVERAAREHPHVRAVRVHDVEPALALADAVADEDDPLRVLRPGGKRVERGLVGQASL